MPCQWAGEERGKLHSPHASVGRLSPGGPARSFVQSGRTIRPEPRLKTPCALREGDPGSQLRDRPFIFLWKIPSIYLLWTKVNPEF